MSTCSSPWSPATPQRRKGGRVPRGAERAPDHDRHGGGGLAGEGAARGRGRRGGGAPAARPSVGSSRPGPAAGAALAGDRRGPVGEPETLELTSMSHHTVTLLRGRYPSPETETEGDAT